MFPELVSGPAVGAQFEARMVEYVKMLNKELRTSTATPPIHRQSK